MVEAIVSDYTKAPITPAERSLLDYAAKLTETPWESSQADVERLRQAGWSDRAILDLTLIVGYFAFVNRIADALGVELEK